MRHALRVMFFALVIACVVPGTSVGAEADRPLGNGDVVTMVQAGLDSDLVISKIRQAPLVAFDVSTDALIVLKKQNVPVAVIDAMLQRMNRNAGTGARPVVLPSVPDGSHVVRVELVAGEHKWDLEPKTATSSTTWLYLATLNWLNIDEPHASVRTTEKTPVIRVFCEGIHNQIGIVRLEANRHDRSLKLTSTKIYSIDSFVNMNVDRDWIITEKWEEISPGVWDAKLPKPLRKGEYGMLDLRARAIYAFAVD
jgi:hypothetical protein